MAPISYYSRLLTDAEKKYSTYEKECLAVIFGCEKCRIYLEHAEFELNCDNLALCWLLEKAKYIGCLGRWILRLAPFKFKVKHAWRRECAGGRAIPNVWGRRGDNPEVTCAALLESLPLVYYSLQEHQQRDEFCVEMRERILAKATSAENFQIHKELLCYFPRRTRRRRWWFRLHCVK
jgi:hypothetical protein